MIVLLFLATIYDLKYRKIPNYLSLLILLVGFFNWKIYLSGLLVSIMILIITLFPKYENYKGGGDIKLIGAIGLVNGLHYTYNLFLLAEILEILFRYIILKPANKNYKQGLPYAPFLLISSIILII